MTTVWFYTSRNNPMGLLTKPNHLQLQLQHYAISLFQDFFIEKL